MVIGNYSSIEQNSKLYISNCIYLMLYTWPYTLHSDDSASSGEQHIPVVDLAVVSCCVRVSCSNGEGGIWEAGVGNNYRSVLKCTVVSPLEGYASFRRLWVYEAGEIHCRFNEMWTIRRVCDHSHSIHCICIE